MAKAYFAAGCFWGIQQRFSRLGGVEKTAVGYMGGVTIRLTTSRYALVKRATRRLWRSSTILRQSISNSYRTFEWHDPTQVNRQGPDIGTSIGLQSSLKQTSSG